VTTGRAYIKATYNNTILTLTDQNGNSLAQCSAGQAGFRGPKKSTPYAASIIVQRAAAKIQPYGLKEVNVFVKGIGGGREAAIRGFNANGIQVLTVKDVTPIPHNGCRPPKRRRVSKKRCRRLSRYCKPTRRRVHRGIRHACVAIVRMI